jgi:ligand-binding sensor domain-containing protein
MLGVRMDFLGILEANDGSIWFGSGHGVHRYDGLTITDFITPPGKVSTLYRNVISNVDAGVAVILVLERVKTYKTGH